MAVRRGLLVAVLAAGTVASGCGSGTKSTSSKSAPAPAPAKTRGGPGSPSAGSAQRAIPAPAPTGAPADPAAVKVIRAWTDALRRGDVSGAARYFALPSTMINGPDAGGAVAVVSIRTRAEAAAANATLPCGAVFLSADQRGRFVNVLFRLTDRPGLGGGCGSGTGYPARTNFVVAGGRIVEWLRAPSDPGDNRRVPAPPPSRRPTPQAPGPTV